MKLGVLVKQVPGSESALRIAPSNTWIEEAAALFEMNESDNYVFHYPIKYGNLNVKSGRSVN